MTKTEFVDSASKPDFYVACLLFCIALGIRIYACPSFALSTDESFTANIALVDSLDLAFKLIWNEGSPPLIYALLKIWTLVLGQSDQTIKLLGITLSSFIPCVAYLVILDLSGARRIAVATCLLCLFSPVLIRFGDMVRPYALTCIFSMLSTWSFFSLFKDKPGKLKCALFVIFNTLNAYSHLWGVLFSLSQIFVVLIQFTLKKWDFEQIKTWIKCASLSAALFLPWLLVVLSQANKDLHPWYQALPWYQFLVVAPTNLISYTVGAKSVYLPFYLVVALSALLFYASIHFNLSDKKGYANCLSWISLFVFVTAVMFATSDIPYRERYLLALTVFIYALICNLLDKLFFWIKNDFVFSLLPFALFSVVWFNQIQILHQMPEASVGTLVSNLQVKGELKSNDTIVVAYNSFVPEVTRKAPGNLIIAAPFKEPYKVMDWQNQASGLKEPQNLDIITGAIKDQFNQNKTVWYIGLELKQGADKNKDPYTLLQLNMQEKIKSWLSKNSRQIAGPKVLNSLDGTAEAIKFSR
ncbi:MAG: glycosyltransferase family 39 protein [Cyanobacteria bacterium TGS_CYA1]|nr:glycosyltransferase family 39 protein [Cyanobacteria bacterium TGS_CYA1]